MASAIEVGDAIVCDDVRREDNGKLLFIGVYSAGIVVSEMPAALVLHLIVKLRTQTPVDAPVQFRVLLNGKQIRSGKGQIGLRKAGSIWAPLSPMVLDKLDTEGDLDFQIQIGDDEWKTACSVPLTKRPSSSAASEPQPPS